jgi:hypothetical protein
MNKYTCLVTSGWFGSGRLREYYSAPDGLANYIIVFISTIKNYVNIVYDKSELDLYANTIIFELHFEVQAPKLFDVPRFLLLLEDKHIRPQNYLLINSLYCKIYTWNDDLIRLNFEKFFFPASCTPGPIGDFNDRYVFTAMIASNKGQAITSVGDLYKERRKIINWYSNNAPNLFNLYGADWDLPDHLDGIIYKLLHKIIKKYNIKRKNQIECWHGKVDSKLSVLRTVKFNFCFENNSTLNGYISEKLYDSFSSGSVPIYFGAPNTFKYVSDKSYINYCNFSSIAELNLYLNSLSFIDYTYMQECMNAEANSLQNIISSKVFAENISSSILKSLTNN